MIRHLPHEGSWRDYQVPYPVIKSYNPKRYNLKSVHRQLLEWYSDAFGGMCMQKQLKIQSTFLCQAIPNDGQVYMYLKTLLSADNRQQCQDFFIFLLPPSPHITDQKREYVNM